MKNSILILHTKKIWGFIFIIFTCIIYSITFDFKLGISFVISLTLAPFLSYVFLKTSLKNIYINFTNTQKFLLKNKTLDLELEIINKNYFSIPFLFVEFLEGDRFFLTINSKYSIFSQKNNSNFISHSIKSKFWGCCIVGIKEISVYDFFGLFRFVLPSSVLSPKYTFEVNICPNIYNIDICDDVLIFENANFDFKESIFEDQTLKNFDLSQIPGYTHKTYIPGEHLKLINWKISAKFDTLLMRKLESSYDTTPILVLDPLGIKNSNENNIFLEESLLEAFLSTINYFVSKSIGCEAYFLYKNNFESLKFCSDFDVSSFQNMLSKYCFISSKNISKLENFQRIPHNIMYSSNKKSILLFTCEFDDTLNIQMQPFENTHIKSTIICLINSHNFVSNNNISQNYKFMEINYA